MIKCRKETRLPSKESKVAVLALKPSTTKILPKTPESSDNCSGVKKQSTPSLPYKKDWKEIGLSYGNPRCQQNERWEEISKKTQPNWAIEAEKCNTVRRKPQPVRSPASFKAQNNTLLLDNENLQNRNKELENQTGSDWQITNWDMCSRKRSNTHKKKSKRSSKHSSHKKKSKQHRRSSSECFSNSSSSSG